jgi:hypothetical protein
LINERIQNDRKKAQIEQIEQEKELSNLKFYFIAITAILLALLFIFVVYKLRNDARKKELQQKLENQKFQNELNSKSERLTQSILSLNRKKDFANEILNRVESFRDLAPHEINSLKLYIENELDIDNSRLDLEHFLSSLGKEFLSRIKTIHPDLTENEIKLIVLIRMNLSLKQIAIIRNISTPSVKIAKNRLKKKLNIPDEQPLLDYLSNF